MKKVLSVTLAFAMVLSLLPAAAFAEDTAPAQKVNLVLVDGQSNAAGSAGEMRGATVAMPDEGEAYIWDGDAAVDLNEYVSAKVESNNTKSVGFHPALAKALNEETGLPTVIIHLGHSGKQISAWRTQYTSTGVAAINACKEWLVDNGFQIANSGYVWLQGESDSCPDFVADYCNYATLNEYYDAYLDIHDAYTEALGEGAVGGMICSVVFMIVYSIVLQFGFGFQVNYLYAVIYGLLGSAVGILGDLCFSVVKRQTGIKDYGNLIPGHGGVLDRFDSMMMVGPLMEALLILIPLAV